MMSLYGKFQPSCLQIKGGERVDRWTLALCKESKKFLAHGDDTFFIIQNNALLLNYYYFCDPYPFFLALTNKNEYYTIHIQTFIISLKQIMFVMTALLCGLRKVEVTFDSLSEFLFTSCLSYYELLRNCLSMSIKMVRAFDLDCL